MGESNEVRVDEETKQVECSGESSPDQTKKKIKKKEDRYWNRQRQTNYAEIERKQHMHRKFSNNKLPTHKTNDKVT